MKRPLLAVLVLAAAACTPLQAMQVARYHGATLTLRQAGAVSDQLHTDCHLAVDVLWPAELRTTAHIIVERESRGIAWADNPTSSAAGCFQLLALHDDRYNDTPGCTVGDKYDAWCNTAAALSLYRDMGWTPWAL